MLSGNVMQSPLTDIETFLDLIPLQLDPGSTRILAGLRCRLWGPIDKKRQSFPELVWRGWCDELDMSEFPMEAHVA